LTEIFPTGDTEMAEFKCPAYGVGFPNEAGLKAHW